METNQFTFGSNILLLWVLKLPGLGIQMQVIPAAAAALTHIAMTLSHFTVIFSGGVGKNGSTVAVSSIIAQLTDLACCMPNIK